jgi:hypothetical protein
MTPGILAPLPAPPLPMTRLASYLFQIAVLLLGVGVLAFLLIEPHFEGRNAHATVYQVYFDDPFLAYVYVGSVPFFLALRRAWRLGGRYRARGCFTAESVEDLRAIQRRAYLILGFLAGAVVFIIRLGDREDRPAGFALVMLVGGATTVVALVAARLARRLQSRLDAAGDSAG